MATKKIREKGHFTVSLVQVEKEHASVGVSAVGNPPQGESIEVQSSKKDGPWNHTVWVAAEFHQDFFKTYLDMVKLAGWALPNHQLIKELLNSQDLGDHKVDIEHIIKNPDAARTIIASLGTIRDNQTKNFREDLIEFAKLLSDRSNETEIHNFLKQRPWIFGIDYIHEATKDKFQVEFGEFDFLLERFNKIYDIVELKGINAPLFEEYRHSETKQGKRTQWKMSEDLSGAVMQVVDYFDEFERVRGDEKARKKRGLLDYRCPRGQIIIGHRDDLKEDQDSLLNQINERFNNIDILTFSDLYDRAEYFVEILEKSILETDAKCIPKTEIKPEDLPF